MNKFKQFLNNQLKLTVLDISLAGIFIGVWLIASRFLSIDFGVMRAGITYAIAIVVGLYFKPLVSVLIAIIADTISLVITDGIGFWMWQYAIIYPVLVLMVSFMKWMFTSKEEKYWLVFSTVIFLITTIGAILVAILNDDFSHSSQGNTFDFTKLWLKILIWSMIGAMVIAYVTMVIIYKNNQSKNLKTIIMVYSIVSIIIVLLIWIWGPYSDIKFLQRFYGEKESVTQLYRPALIFRILKTPIILPLYTIIVYPLYKTMEALLKTKAANKWN